jgi:hypothetical protein
MIYWEVKVRCNTALRPLLNGVPIVEGGGAIVRFLRPLLNGVPIVEGGGAIVRYLFM